MCVKSEETSPTSTRTSSMPSLNVLCDSSEVYNRSPQSRSRKLESLSQHNKLDGARSKGDATSSSKTEDRNYVSTDEDEEMARFCVADVRKRLISHLHTPKKLFSRDPEDPSG